MKNNWNNSRNRQRPIRGQRTRLTTRTILMVSAALLAVGTAFTIITLNLSNPTTSEAASIGDYQTVSSGNWTNTAVWARWDGSAWVTPAPSIPSSADGTINILSGHVVTINSVIAASIDQLTIDAGATLDIVSGSLNLANGAGTDLTVNGTLKSAVAITVAASANIAFASGGKFQLMNTNNAGTIPVATWDANSSCEIVGYTTNTTLPANFVQAYGNLVWNCPSQSGVVTWSSFPTGTANLTVNSTGASQIQLANNTVTIALTGNYVQTGGNVSLNSTNSKVTTLNIGGNWTHTGGTLLCGGNSNTVGGVYFNKAGIQTYSAAGNTVTGNVDFYVSTGCTLDVGTSVILGRDFNISSGAAMMIGSPNGIQATGNSGNVQSSRNRVYNTTADYIFNGTSSQQTGAGFPAQVRNLRFNNSNGITLTNSVTVSGQLTLDNGNITASGDTLTLGTSATVTGTLVRTNGHIVGTFRRWIAATTASNILFPIGSVAYYNSAEMDFTTAPAGGTIVASFITTKPDATGLPMVDGGETCMNIGFGYWQFAAANGFSGGTYNVRLAATGMPGISDPPTLHLAQRSANGASWSSNGTHAAGTGTVFLPIVNRTGMTSLGQYGIISGSSNVLPIELLYFRANWNNYQVDLTWATATETNNDHFVIERSLNGEDFTGVLEIAGRGTTTQASYYSASDKKPFTGRSYYRLKQVDHDGSYSYSDVKVVNSPWMSTGNTPLEVSRVYPNPCADNFHVTYRSATGKPVRVSLYNLEGKLMHEDEWETTTQGMVEEMIDMHTMPHGTYFLSLQSGDERISKRIIRL